MENDHPSKDIKGSLGNSLLGKTICVCLTGSVAVVNSPSLCRHLIRLGAEVYVIMSNAATKLINPDLLYWATGHKVITELTGAIEHVYFAGERPGVSGKADLILIAPATANTISKIACAIDDTPVTTIATTAFGSNTPIIIAPAMHESMYNHPILNENIQKLISHNIEIILPRINENKAKIPQNQIIIDSVLRNLNRNYDLKNKRFLITAGPCREFFDRVRFISNPSSGKMGLEIANEVISRGGEVLLIMGRACSVKIPENINIKFADSALEFLEIIKNSMESQIYDVFISAAAISDYTPINQIQNKVQSKLDKLVIELKPTPKIIEEVRKLDPNIYITAFKAETNLDEKELVNKAFERLKSANANLIIANDVFSSEKTGFQCDTNEVFIINNRKEVKHVSLRSKRKISKEIIDEIINNLSKDSN